jgi:hypothetical protein
MTQKQKTLRKNMSRPLVIILWLCVSGTQAQAGYYRGIASVFLEMASNTFVLLQDWPDGCNLV